MNVCDVCGVFTHAVIKVGSLEFCSDCHEQVKESDECREYLAKLEKEVLDGN